MDASRSCSLSEDQEILAGPIYDLWTPDAFKPNSLPPPLRSPTTSALARRRQQLSPRLSYNTPSIDTTLIGSRSISRTSHLSRYTAQSAPTSPALHLTTGQPVESHASLITPRPDYIHQQQHSSITMASVAEYPRPMVRSSSHRVGVNLEDAAYKKTVRRGEGSRAGSEAGASLRSKSAQADIP